MMTSRTELPSHSAQQTRRTKQQWSMYQPSPVMFGRKPRRAAVVPLTPVSVDENRQDVEVSRAPTTLKWSEHKPTNRDQVFRRKRELSDEITPPSTVTIMSGACGRVTKRLKPTVPNPNSRYLSYQSFHMGPLSLATPIVDDDSDDEDECFDSFSLAKSISSLTNFSEGSISTASEMSEEPSVRGSFDVAAEKGSPKSTTVKLFGEDSSVDETSTFQKVVAASA